MIKDTDLDAAVGEGIISRDQAMQLRDLAKRTAEAAGETLDFTPETRDEPFRLLRGFRDVFIAIAVAIFAFGLSSLATAFSNGYNFMFETVGTAEDRVWLLVTSTAWMVIGVLLAEWITRRQRLPLASLVMSLAFAFWSMSFVTAVAINLAPDVFTGVEKIADGATIWARIVGVLLGLIFFYWRYRLPFTLLPLAGAAVFMGYSLVGAALGEAWAEDNSRYIIGGLGLCVFALAMWFDVKDRLRVTRFSECAFWLHLLAAPMLVHAILFDTSGDSAKPVVIFGIMAALAVVALLIDRRALLVSGLSYLAVAIAQIVSGSELLKDLEFGLTAFILGAILLALGLGWTAIRRTVVSWLPSAGLRAALPPVAPG
ncbi:MAG: hypothetical protein ACR2PM_04365 [Hyphomicrobiales bacterium]